MKKYFVFILFSMLTGSLYSQDYQMFYSRQTTLFENSYKLLIGCRFDSASFDTDSVFFPFHTIGLLDDDCATPYGNSWLGEKIILKSGGDHFFINAEGDTIVIRTKTNPGENWIVYENENISIYGFIISLEKESFLGLEDSVKTIGFQVYDSQMNPFENELNDMSLKISKNHGALRILNFNLFPDLEDFLSSLYRITMLDLVGIESEHQSAGIKNLSWFKVYDFLPGDAIHILETNTDFYSEDIGQSYTHKLQKKYLEREDYPDSIKYLVEINSQRRWEIHSSTKDSVRVQNTHDTIKEVVRHNPEFDKLPGEAVIEGETAYAYRMYNSDPLNKTRSDIGEIWNWYTDSCWAFCCVDGCFMDLNYVEGLGGPYGSCSNFDSYGGHVIKLVYYEKNGVTWGSPLILEAPDKKVQQSSIIIYPNPARDILKFEFVEQGNKSITFTDLSGKKVLHINSDDQEKTLIINHLEPGTYIITIHLNGVESCYKILKQ